MPHADSHRTAVANESARHLALADQFSARNYAPLPVVIARGRGAWVEDVEGKRYLDLLSAYSALNFGHAHVEIVSAFVEQAKMLSLTSRAFQNDQFGPFCEDVTKLAGQDLVLPMNTGAEAVETALKTARKWGYRVKGVPANEAEIIVCEGNFHGRTISIVSFSDDPQYRDGFGPFTPGFKVVPYGDKAALDAAIGPNTAAFLVEPIQGEAGIIIPEAGYLKHAARLCRERNALLICDEIQSGLGRTGKLFACEWEDVRPDAMIVGKALSGGFYPVSAVLASDDAMAVFHPGDHGSTFGGNPLACAVAIASLEVLRDEGLVEKSRTLGEYFLQRLRDLKAATVKEVRGKGLWIGVDIRKECGTARPYCEHLMELGLLAKETHEQVVRIAPPLVITKDEIDWAVERIGQALAVNHG